MAVRKSMGIPPASPRIKIPVAATKRGRPPKAATPVADARVGRLQLSAWIPEAAKEQLDLWAVKNRKSRQYVVEEALNLWFASVGLHRIARSSE